VSIDVDDIGAVTIATPSPVERECCSFLALGYDAFEARAVTRG